MTKGLALSGGGARGSFQMGAIDCLYTVFGYRPDVIAGTSVGSVNALVLAQASSSNDKLTQMTKLRSIWLSLTGPNDFYTIQPWLARILKANSLDFGGGLPPRSLISSRKWSSIPGTSNGRHLWQSSTLSATRWRSPAWLIWPSWLPACHF